YFDPKGKSGIHHLFEHLSAFTPLKIAQKHHTYFNATTSSQEVRLIARGTANPQVMNYGLWNVLPDIIRQIIPPYEFTEKLSGILEKEKEVVFNEINEDQANHNSHVRKAIDAIVLDSSNPIRTNTMGKKEDMESI